MRGTARPTKRAESLTAALVERKGRAPVDTANLWLSLGRRNAWGIESKKKKNKRNRNRRGEEGEGSRMGDDWRCRGRSDPRRTTRVCWFCAGFCVVHDDRVRYLLVSRLSGEVGSFLRGSFVDLLCSFCYLRGVHHGVQSEAANALAHDVG